MSEEQLCFAKSNLLVFRSLRKNKVWLAAAPETTSICTGNKIKLIEFNGTVCVINILPSETYLCKMLQPPSFLVCG